MMTYEQKFEELNLLVEEAIQKRDIANKELTEINDWIKDLRNKQKAIAKTHKEAEARLDGASIQGLHDKLSAILRGYKDKGEFFFHYYGTENVDIEKAIEEKVFLNKMIDVMGGKRIMKFWNTRNMGLNKTRVVQKGFSRKMTHPVLMKAIAPYLLDLDEAKSRTLV